MSDVSLNCFGNVVILSLRGYALVHNTMTIPRGHIGLQFPCECVSASDEAYSDPWADIAKRKLLPNGTKEEIINLVAEEPKTLSQLADALSLSPPSIHTHINDLLKSELLRESVEWEKKYPAERYYEPNFPVFKRAECEEFMSLCNELAEQMARLFQSKMSKFKGAYNRTGLSQQGWEFSDVTQCLYANAQRHARRLLEEQELLPSRQKRGNGAEWIFWAQQPD